VAGELKLELGGPPRKIRKDVETVRFVVSNFQDRRTKPGECMYSPLLKAHGYEWRIVMRPRFSAESSLSSSTNSMSFFLKGCGPKAVTAAFAFGVQGCHDSMSQLQPYYLFGSDYHPSWKFGNLLLLPRNYVLHNCLEADGSFVIECDIRIAAEHACYPTMD